jgi:N-acetylglucosaminyl-diphospho-decaprenol L-rhamnosyltransferase
VTSLSIFIISHNTRELTLACLRSLFAQTCGIKFEVIVADNASADGSAEAIADTFPTVRLLEPGVNLGFAAGNNLAARHARGEFLLLLNPDTVLLNDSVAAAVAFARSNPDAGIVGGRTLFADGTLNPSSCHGRPTPWSLFCAGVGLSSVFRRSRWFDPESLGRWQRDTVREVPAVTGCFLLIRRELWERLGGFDEAFFMYGEETDLCLRAAKLGQRCVICPEAQLVHYGGRSERARADKMVKLFRAKAQLFERHWDPRWIGFGITMLKLWALTRMVAFGLASLVNPKRRESYETWRKVWRNFQPGHTGPRTEALDLCHPVHVNSNP